MFTYNPFAQGGKNDNLSRPIREGDDDTSSDFNS